MKIFIFFFLLFISQVSFSFEIGICEDSAGNSFDCGTDSTTTGFPEYEAVYDPVTGTTSIQKVDGTVNTPGVWNPKTFSCTNYVNPTVNAAGDIICPSVADAKFSKSTVAPNPSKDDKACDPSKGADSGCASQETSAKTNDLISESNSKLGSIASSNATNTGLLGGILGTLQGIASQGSAGTGSGSGSIDAEDKNVDSISVASSIGMCPAAEQFTVLNSNYELSYQFLCDMAESMRGFVIALGALSALTMVVTAL